MHLAVPVIGDKESPPAQDIYVATATARTHPQLGNGPFVKTTLEEAAGGQSIEGIVPSANSEALDAVRARSAHEAVKQVRN